MKTRTIPVLIMLIITSQLFAQDVILNTTTGRLSGTVVMPENNQTKTIVILHAGSGPTDRNGNQSFLKNNSLKMLAEALAENGIASLRYDKRAIGESKIENFREEEYRFDDLVEDLKGWITKIDTEYDFENIVVAGHSEGSLIGILSSIENPVVDKFISIAGPGTPADELLLTQMAAQGPGVEEMVAPYIKKLKNGDTIANPPTSLASLLRPSVQPYVISWFQYDPVKEIAKLDIPVLIIQGSSDIQVAVSEAEILHEAAEDSEMVIIKHMNHVLKSCKTTEFKTQMATYGNPDLPLSKKFVKTLVKFISK